jgi:pimeloyl-ACP methyl ester carboxylesterase
MGPGGKNLAVRVMLRAAVHVAGMMVLVCCGLFGQRMRDFQAPQPMPRQSTLVIGFVGGFERWNDPHRGVRKVALNIRQMHLPGVYAETLENHRAGTAVQLIRRALDADGNGQLDDTECADARVILYGQSWGGAAVIKVARALQQWNVPVLLTVQVDSVGFADSVIPGNVHEAANFYQHDLFTIQGRQAIRAEDPLRTHILGNIQMSYFFRPYGSLNESDSSWIRRVLGGSHAKMEVDPIVWMSVQALILDAIAE